MKTFNKALIITGMAFTLAFAMNIEEAHARGGKGGGRRGGFSRGGSRGGSRSGGFNRSRGGSRSGGFNRGRGSKSGGFNRGGHKGGSQIGHKNNNSNRGRDTRIGGKSEGPKVRDTRFRGDRFKGGKNQGGFHKGEHHKGGHHKGDHHKGGHFKGGKFKGGKHHWHHGHHGHHGHKHWGKWHGKHFGHHHHHHHGWGYFHRRPRFGWGFAFFYRRPRYVYCNPYCVTNVVSVYDYSQPLGPADGQTTSQPAMDYFTAAREAFFAGNLQAAMENIDLAIKEAPSNPDLHQFRSLVLFAQKDYRSAAAAAHVALTAGPGWNWETMKSLFPSADIYTAQLRELEETRNLNKEDAAIRFLLAYHYLMLGHQESAVKELTKVVELEPRDQMAAELLTKVTGQEVQPQETQQPAQPPQNNGGGLGALGFAGAEAPTVDVKQVKEEKPEVRLSGDFKASPAEGVEFRLSLKQDKTFVWSFKTPESESSFEGTYTIADNELTLVRKQDSDKLIGIVTPIEGGFNLKMKDADSQDPGLDFTK